MLPFSARLRAAEVVEILKSGRPLRAVYVTARAIPAPNLRYAVVAPKKPFRTAVMRNKVRRAAYRALSQIDTPAHANVVFFIRSLPEGPLTEGFRTEMESILNKLIQKA